MVDIELVIKIPKDTHNDIIKNGFIYDEDNEVVTHAIKKGTPHETVTEFADRCRECGRERLLDKIRAEIDQKQYDFMSDGDYNEGVRFGLMLAYQIIDKCKAESEVQVMIELFEYILIALACPLVLPMIEPQESEDKE